jgi:A/G-specific adenine glycosylase
MDKQKPHLYNQAIMELGAIVCSPKNPGCATCPLNTGCVALSSKIIAQLPAKSKRTTQKARYFFYLVPLHGDHTFISKRNDKDIWHSLYEFPLVEYQEQKKPDDLLNKPDGLLKDLLLHAPEVTISPLYTHHLTHQRLMTYFIVIQLNRGANPNLKGFEKVRSRNLVKYPFPRLINRFLTDYPKLFGF